jgi:hypothetical protein
MKQKKAKHYPMNGPSMEAQRLMESPRANRARLRQILTAKGSLVTREETLAILELK